jgi:hypothetical protein
MMMMMMIISPFGQSGYGQAGWSRVISLDGEGCSL